MATFFYYSGIVAWVALGCRAILAGLDTAIDWTVHSLWTKREFLAFSTAVSFLVSCAIEGIVAAYMLIRLRHTNAETY